MLLVAQPDQRGVIGRGGQLDVDRAPTGAGAQVLVRDVPVVLTGADHAGGQVVGAQKIEKVGVPEAPIGLEQPVGKRQPVARRDSRDQLGRGCALEVDVKLGFRHGVHGVGG